MKPERPNIVKGKPRPIHITESAWLRKASNDIYKSKS